MRNLIGSEASGVLYSVHGTHTFRLLSPRLFNDWISAAEVYSIE
jgi:hypothetical protein